MHCERARDRLFEHLDAGSHGPADAELDAHLDGCADCRTLRDDLLTLQARSRVWHDVPPPPWNPAPGPGAAGAAPGPGTSWRSLLLHWFPPVASAAALLLAAGVYWQSAGTGSPSAPTSAAVVPSVPVDQLLATSRRERQEEMAALSALLKAEMDRRSLETEQSLKYIISHQIQSQRQLEAIRGRLAPDATPATAEQL